MEVVHAPSVATSSTAFPLLPNTAKRAIFDHSELRSLKTCRLVCKEWFHLINSSQRFQKRFHLKLSDQNWNWSLELLRSLNEEAILKEQNQTELTKEGQTEDEGGDEDGDNLPAVVLPAPTISHLRVSDLTVPIPIYSASRSRIPKSKSLSLYSGVTRQNLVQLLQYQASIAEQLHLHDFCLVSLNTNCQFLNPRTIWANLARFTFEFWYETHKVTFLDYTKHVLALGKLLSIIEVPNLRILSAGIDCPKFQEAYHGRARIKLMDYISRNFNRKFATFLFHWGGKLTRFGLYFHGINAEPIFQAFKYLTKVHKLKLKLHGNDSDVKASDLGRACKHFNRLTVLELSLPPEFEETVSSVLVYNNKSTLLTLQLQNWVTSLKWIPPPAESNLGYMELRWKIQKNDFLLQRETAQMLGEVGDKTAAGNTYKKLNQLKIYLNVDLSHDEYTMDLRHTHRQLLNWIPQFMPNLTQLDLISTNALITDLVDIPLLISGLPHVRQVDVYDRWRGLHRGIPLYELERWCKETEDVRGTWMNGYTYYRVERSVNLL